MDSDALKLLICVEQAEANTCVSIQPEPVNLLIHDGGVSNEHIQLH